jgi:hypothetical protein
MHDPVSDRDWADAWLYAVLADASLSAGTKAIAALLRLHWNAFTALSSPSLEGLAVRSAQSLRAVEKQRSSLKAGNYIAWTASRGRRCNDYQLLLTPAVWRELARINPEHPAVVGHGNPQQAAGDRPVNSLGQPPTTVRPTPDFEAANPRPTAVQTLKPNKPVTAAPLDAILVALARRVGARDWQRCSAGLEIDPGPPPALIFERNYQLTQLRTAHSQAVHELLQGFDLRVKGQAA